MTFWVCYEGPKRWCVRLGKDWHITAKVKIQVPCETKTGPRQPYGYVTGRCVDAIIGQRVIILK